MEAYLQEGAKVASTSEIDFIWKFLGSNDRGLRHAARVALEKQPVKAWKERLAADANPVSSTAAMIALARVDGEGSAPEIIAKAKVLITRRPNPARPALIFCAVSPCR